ncbi:hypothetical protein [Kineococcus sp. SYSU DK002]|uniref:hypothetical protein n=1 Tax=Kineococcus sp. SYSU DK002 TaxID=3383123 RepID=UPI003D7D32B4
MSYQPGPHLFPASSTSVRRLLLVRGGEMKLDDLERSVKILIAKQKPLDLSFWGMVTDDPAALLSRVRNKVPHPSCRFVWADDLPSVGLIHRKTGAACHYDVALPDHSWYAKLQALLTVMGPVRTCEDLLATV